MRGAAAQQIGYGAQSPDEKPIAAAAAEAALLGAMMINNAIVPEVVDCLSVDDFYEQAHARIFKAIARLHERGADVISPITLKPIFDNDPVLEELGGAGYLAKLTGSSAVLLGFREFIAQIRDTAARRRILAAIDEGRERIQSDFDADVGEIADEIEQAFSRVSDRRVEPKAASAADMIDLVIERNERLQAGTGAIGATCRSITDLNVLFDAFEPGTMLVWAGRPGMGKTTVALSAAWGFAANGHPTEYYHAEMTREQLAMRLTSDISHGMGSPILHRSIRRAHLTINECRTLVDVREKIATLPLQTIPSHNMSIARLRAKVRRSKQRWAKKGRRLEVVFVDYLQLLQAHDEHGRLITDDKKRVDAISAGLRQIADEEQVCLIALSQLSRAVEARADKRPQMSDLRDSGRLEQDADGVLLFYREEYYLKQEEPKVGDKRREAWEIDLEAAREKLDMILGKWRHGEGRTRQTKFFGKFYAVRGGDFYPEDQQDLLL